MNMAMLPRSYFPPEAAVKILFIGKALQILRRRYGPTMAVQDPGALSDAARQFRQHQALFGQFFVALKSRPRFNVYVLGKAIEKIRRIVAKHLWRVVVSVFFHFSPCPPMPRLKCGGLGRCTRARCCNDCSH